MRRPTRRAERPEIAVAAGERLLAWATTSDQHHVGGTREALYLPGDLRVPWEGVEAADWDNDTSVLHVSEVGSWGESRPEHRLTIEEPGRLLELVRERVTASVVLQRQVPLEGRRGLRVIARRGPGAASEISWIFEYDEGIDPHDGFVRLAAAEALAAARDELGLS
ncbi:hypothetical protein BH09ACT12_BH09ACT12_10850 [soil metagenome]